MGPGIVLLRLIGRGGEVGLVKSVNVDGSVEQHSAEGFGSERHRHFDSILGVMSEIHCYSGLLEGGDCVVGMQHALRGGIRGRLSEQPTALVTAVVP